MLRMILQAAAVASAVAISGAVGAAMPGAMRGPAEAGHYEHRSVAVEQVPVPFPRPGQPTPPKPAAPATATPATPRPAPNPQTGEPTEEMLGVAVYPSAHFIASYNAGSGQRYYLYGSESDFLQIVGYYKTMLKQKGELIFDEPPIHMFELAKFKEETMAFTPSVTVKDYTSGGSAGYLNPKRGESPARYKTIIQIVPAPPVPPK